MICSKTVAIPDNETGPCEADRRLLALLGELLFLENSRPVHRQLLSGLQRLPAKRFAAFRDIILEKVCLHSQIVVLWEGMCCACYACQACKSEKRK